ncbi:hypothetical protein M405DRAFT_835720 [Rhizopogon salebrosus TDB-379]|nr:hypothetical protein M405DRAFT_835720 [Rhizopogon salebrosus TDB-379]
MWLRKSIALFMKAMKASPNVFTTKWAPVASSAEWNDPQAEQDMVSLLKMRSVVLSLLEKARGHKHLKNSLEAEVDIILPNDLSARPYFLQLIEREETFLKTLFIVCQHHGRRHWFICVVLCLYNGYTQYGYERGGGDSRETFILE